MEALWLLLNSIRASKFVWSWHTHYWRVIQLVPSAAHIGTCFFPSPQGPRDRELHLGALPLGLRGCRCLLPVWPALLGPGRCHRHHQRSRWHRDGHFRWATLTLCLWSLGVWQQRLGQGMSPTSSESLTEATKGQCLPVLPAFLLYASQHWNTPDQALWQDDNSTTLHPHDIDNVLSTHVPTPQSLMRQAECTSHSPTCKEETGTPRAHSLSTGSAQYIPWAPCRVLGEWIQKVTCSLCFTVIISQWLPPQELVL